MLRGLLRAQYPSQTITVVNAGSAGEFASGDGLKRFGPTLAANTPEVVLLMEGTNDLLFAHQGIEPALSALDAMMRDAESRNIRVCLATIPPQRAGGARSRDLVAGLIPGFNDKVRALAVSHNAVLVDVYAGMKDDLRSSASTTCTRPRAATKRWRRSTAIDCESVRGARDDERLWRAGRFRGSPRRERSDRTEPTGSAGALAGPRRHPAT